MRIVFFSVDFTAIIRSDGGFVMTGLTLNGPDCEGDMYLTKINAAGAAVWTRHYGRPMEDGGNDLLPTSDGGYLVIGHTAFTYGVSRDGYLVKTNAEGHMQWYALIGTAYDDVCDAAIELEDGSFLVGGHIEDAFSRTFRIMLAHVSASGKVCPGAFACLRFRSSKSPPLKRYNARM
jgi:hypothetical protein